VGIAFDEPPFFAADRKSCRGFESFERAVGSLTVEVCPFAGAFCDDVDNAADRVGTEFSGAAAADDFYSFDLLDRNCGKIDSAAGRRVYPYAVDEDDDLFGAGAANCYG